MNLVSTVRNLTLAAGLALSLSACGINSVPEQEELAKEAWGNVENAYQRRADLIPNLVSTVRAAAESEEEILTQVIEARSQASSVQLDGTDLTDPSKFQQFEQAQGQLGSALSRLLLVVERYPELQSQQRFADLMVALEGSENRINTMRDRYNAAVREYNTTIRTFPDIIGANIIHGADPMESFSAQAGAENAPVVEFGEDS